MMDAAATSERITRLKEVIPVELGLVEAGFVKKPPLDVFTWDHHGLNIAAGEDWLFGWSFLATSVTARTALCDEFRLPREMTRGDLLVRLLRCWRDVFPKVPAPEAWQDGLLWEQFQDELRRVRERATMRLHADTTFLRLTINRLRETRSTGEIRLGHIPGQLVVAGGDVEYHVPAYGHWLGWCEVKRSLLDTLPARFPAHSTPIEYMDGMLAISYHAVPALWRECD